MDDTCSVITHFALFSNSPALYQDLDANWSPGEELSGADMETEDNDGMNEKKRKFGILI